MNEHLKHPHTPHPTTARPHTEIPCALSTASNTSPAGGAGSARIASSACGASSVCNAAFAHNAGSARDTAQPNGTARANNGTLANGSVQQRRPYSKKAIAAFVMAMSCVTLAALTACSMLYLFRGEYDPADVTVFLAMLGTGMLTLCTAVLSVILGIVGVNDCGRVDPYLRCVPRGHPLAESAIIIGAIPIILVAGIALFRG